MRMIRRVCNAPAGKWLTGCRSAVWQRPWPCTYASKVWFPGFEGWRMHDDEGINNQRANASTAMPSTAAISISRAPLGLLGAEPWRAVMEYWAFHVDVLKRKSLAPMGDGHPVLIFPGLATNGSALGPLRDHCESLGYQAIDWGRGYNTGPKGGMGWNPAVFNIVADRLGQQPANWQPYAHSA